MTLFGSGGNMRKNQFLLEFACLFVILIFLAALLCFAISNRQQENEFKYITYDGHEYVVHHNTCFTHSPRCSCITTLVEKLKEDKKGIHFYFDNVVTNPPSFDDWTPGYYPLLCGKNDD